MCVGYLLLQLVTYRDKTRVGARYSILKKIYNILQQWYGKQNKFARPTKARKVKILGDMYIEVRVDLSLISTELSWTRNEDLLILVVKKTSSK